MIHFYQLQEWELYDLSRDPDELQNQYNNPDYVSTVADLKLQLGKLREKYKDDSDVSVQPREWQEKMRERGKKKG